MPGFDKIEISDLSQIEFSPRTTRFVQSLESSIEFSLLKFHPLGQQHKFKSLNIQLQQLFKSNFSIFNWDQIFLTSGFNSNRALSSRSNWSQFSLVL